MITSTLINLFDFLDCNELQVYFPTYDNMYEYAMASGKIYVVDGTIQNTCYCDIYNDIFDIFHCVCINRENRIYKVTAFEK